MSISVPRWLAGKPVKLAMFVALVIGIVAAPAAQAESADPTQAQGRSFIVTLADEPGTEACTQDLAAVLAENEIVPSQTFTSALCGFAARLSPKQVAALESDARVASVVRDTRVKPAGT